MLTTEKERIIASHLMLLEIEAHEKALCYIDSIIDVIKKFEGKQLSKRLSTALKEIDEYLYIEYSSNSIVISLGIRAIPERTYQYEETKQTYYIKNDTIYIVHCSKIENGKEAFCYLDGSINSLFISEKLERSRVYIQERIDSMTKSLKNIAEYEKEYQELEQKIKDFNSKVDVFVKEYFGLDKLKTY